MNYGFQAWIISAMVGGAVLGFVVGLFIGVLFA